ncbi:MAG: thiamine pyrophosphate-binding protein [Chloroflexota bacterium]
MAKVDGGTLAAKALKAEGVRYLFGLWGGHIAAIFHGADSEGMKIIDVRHEQAAGHAAEGWSRVTGQMGVAVVTAGPGVTDVVTAVANAYQAGSPMLVLAGRSPVGSFEKSPLQEMDHLEFMKPITKWARTVYETKRIPEYISMAYKYALAGKPGPVVLECPMDIFNATVEESEVVFPEPAKSRTTARVPGNPELVKAAAELLSKAQRPAVMAGSTVYWSHASEELQKFIETIGAPVFLNGMGRGCIPADHPQFSVYSRRLALGQADVIVLIGTVIDFRLNYGAPPLFNKGVKVIQIDIDQTEIGHNRPIDVGILGDTKEVLKQLLAELPAGKVTKHPEWLEKLRAVEAARTKELEPFMHSDAVPIHPVRLLREVRDFLDRDAIVVGDGGDIVSYAAQILKINYPGHWLDPGKLGCLGVGTGFAMAAKLAEPDKQVLIVNGDGAFGLNAMEFDTMARHNIPVVSVIGNNRAWSPVPQGSVALGRALGKARYDKMVEALGGHGEFVERPEQIRPALERSFSSGLPACINVIIDQTMEYGHLTSTMSATA